MPKKKAPMKRDIVTGRSAPCLYCGELVREVQDPYSGCLDYETVDHDGKGSGDFGCGDSPETNDEGTGGHWPLFRVSALLKRLIPLDNAIHAYTQHPAIGSMKEGTTA